MKHPVKFALGSALLLASSILHADQASDDAQAAIDARAAARRVAVTVCASCHGPQGRSISPKFPQLAGQKASYLVAQMKNFKAQTRGDPDAIAYMWGMSATLDDELINGLAGYFSAQQAQRGNSGKPAEVARGKEIYLAGVAAEGVPPCAACHGTDATGTDEFPRLAGQKPQYLLKQLRSFQNNQRNVAIMHGVAGGLKLNEMTSVAAYLQSL
jgi:cytochrome c553